MSNYTIEVNDNSPVSWEWRPMCVFTLNGTICHSFSPPYWVSEEQPSEVTFPESLMVHAMSINECETVLTYLLNSGSYKQFRIVHVNETEPMFEAPYGQGYCNQKSIEQDAILEDSITRRKLAQ